MSPPTLYLVSINLGRLCLCVCCRGWWVAEAGREERGGGGGGREGWPGGSESSPTNPLRLAPAQAEADTVSPRSPLSGSGGGGRGMAGRASRCHLSTRELVQASFSQCPDTNIDTRAVYIWDGCWVRQAVGRPQAGTPWEELDPNGRIQCHGQHTE